MPNPGIFGHVARRSVSRIHSERGGCCAAVQSVHPVNRAKDRTDQYSESPARLRVGMFYWPVYQKLRCGSGVLAQAHSQDSENESMRQLGISEWALWYGRENHEPRAGQSEGNERKLW